MRVRTTVVAAMIAAFAAQADAAVIMSITLNGGSFSGIFSANGQTWDTVAGNGIWGLGITNPTVGAPFLNAANTSLSPPLATGTYWSYNEPTNFGSAIQLTVNFDTGTQTAVFATGNLATAGQVWTRLAGSTELSVASTGQTQLNRVSSGENLTPGGSADAVLQLGLGTAAAVPEPQTLSVVAGGLLLFWRLRRRSVKLTVR
jgi:hypothetical protein